MSHPISLLHVTQTHYPWVTQLTCLPPELNSMTHLRWLGAENNPLTAGFGNPHQSFFSKTFLCRPPPLLTHQSPNPPPTPDTRTPRPTPHQPPLTPPPPPNPNPNPPPHPHPSPPTPCICRCPRAVPSPLTSREAQRGADARFRS